MVITTASASLDDQHDLRRRKYLIMMGLRVVCVIGAVLTASVSLWLALALIAGGAVLPWCAVLIANDRPAQRSTTFVRYRPPDAAPALEDLSNTRASSPTSAGVTSHYVLEAPPAPVGQRSDDGRRDDPTGSDTSFRAGRTDGGR